MANIVYVLTNPAMPELVKIGMTSNLTDRLRSLSAATGVPAPFEVYYACEVRDDLTMAGVERSLHFAFAPYRFSSNREFFRMDPERVRVILQMVAKPETAVETDPEEYAKEVEEVRQKSNPKKRGRVSFASLDIPLGSVLEFKKDFSIKCKVHDDYNVEFNGQIMSLSAAATLVWNSNFGKTWKCCHGPADWIYDGLTLFERRNLIERNEFDFRADD